MNLLEKEILEQVPLGLLVTDSNNLVQYANRSYTKITGYLESELLYKKPLFLSKLHEEIYEQIIIDHIHEAGIWKGILKHSRKNDSEYEQVIFATTLKDMAGRISGYIYILVDTVDKGTLSLNHFFNESITSFILDHSFGTNIFDLGRDLEVAIHENQLKVLYQPQVDTREGVCFKVEALARWKHPVLGLLSPNLFIPIAEQLGIIDKLGQCILEQACDDIRQWAEAGFNDIHVAVNVSPSQLKSSRFLNLILDTLIQSGINNEKLEIEITESTFLDGHSKTITLLNDLRNHGIKIALDDFGIGYSSLAYLKKFPIDILKIDTYFTQDSSYKGKAILSNIISLAHILDLKVVAEGVENVEQKMYLEQNGCYMMQGYYFSKPMTSNDLLGYLKKSNRNVLMKG